MGKNTGFAFIFILFIGFLIFSGCYNMFETGYLKSDLSILNGTGTEGIKLFFGSFIKGGTMTVWVDSDGNLYREPEKNLKYGIASDKSLLDFTDKNENGLQQAKIKANISPSMLTADFKEVIKEAEDLYYEHCSTCHIAPDLTKKYNLQPKGVIQSMVSHTNIPKDDAELLKRYVSLAISN